MTLSTMKKISIWVSFFLCFIAHYVYDYFPSFLTSIFFPVNESIFEHIKMMITSILIWEFFEFLLLKKYRVCHNNFWISVFCMLVLSVPVFLIIYYPIYKWAGDVFVLNVLCLFITIYFVNIVQYYILKSDICFNDTTGIILIVILYIVIGFLTYYPLDNFLFMDPVTLTFGIK